MWLLYKNKREKLPFFKKAADTYKEYKGVVPSNSVVIPGTRPKEFPSGEFQTPCALIIGTEDKGISKEWLENSYKNVKIPKTKKTIKLNVKNFLRIELALKKFVFTS